MQLQLGWDIGMGAGSTGMISNERSKQQSLNIMGMAEGEKLGVKLTLLTKYSIFNFKYSKED